MALNKVPKIYFIIIWKNNNCFLKDQVLSIQNLESLIEHAETKEDLEQKMIFNDSQLRAREDEIKLVS